MFKKILITCMTSAFYTNNIYSMNNSDRECFNIEDCESILPRYIQLTLFSFIQREIIRENNIDHNNENIKYIIDSCNALKIDLNIIKYCMIELVEKHNKVTSITGKFSIATISVPELMPKLKCFAYLIADYKNVEIRELFDDKMKNKETNERFIQIQKTMDKKVNKEKILAMHKKNVRNKAKYTTKFIQLRNKLTEKVGEIPKVDPKKASDRILNTMFDRKINEILDEVPELKTKLEEKIYNENDLRGSKNDTLNSDSNTENTPQDESNDHLNQYIIEKEI